MASFIVKSAAQQLGNLLVEEAKFLYKVHDKIGILQTELEWMECFLEDADNRQHQEKLVRKWVAQIIEFAYEAEDIIERYLHQVSDQRRDGILDTIKWFSKILLSCQFSTLHNLGLDIDELIVQVSDLNKRLRRYGIQFMRPTESLAYDAMMREERRTYSHIEEEVVGLEKDVQQVVAKLTKEQVKVISISGMGGLGKTTLARKVFSHKDVKQHFGNSCVWVYVSKEFSRRSVFEEILNGLRASDKSSASEIKALSDEELAKTIYEVIRNSKCLVVLDDIWTTKAWDSLEPALGSVRSSSCSSKILLSTRNRVLLQYVGSNGHPHCLGPLDDENSWKLLQHKAFPQKWNPVDVEEKTKKENMEREMLKHCDGVPLAIIALRGILSSKTTLAEWEEVQKNISAYLMADMSKNKGILPVLELSYQDLPFYLKPCFLYLGVFPEDYEIPTGRLYHLWEAEGILADPTRNESEVKGVTSYEIGERYLFGLIQRSMVQVGKRWPNGRIRTCRVHDLMRDMCIQKCRETSFLDVSSFNGPTSIFADGCVMRKQIHRCAFHGKAEGVAESSSTQNGKMKITCVRSVSIFPLEGFFGTEDLRKIVNSFPLLRVLDLQRASTFEEMSLEVEHPIHLRYLNLSGVSFDLKFSSQLWKLKYLITLDLRGGGEYMRNFRYLANKFHQMERLRHLYLPDDFEVTGEKGSRLNFKADQMETLKNFDPERCEWNDLLQMSSLRVFSIKPGYVFERADELKLLAKSPVMKSGHLINTLRLSTRPEVVDKDPTILGFLSCFTKLKLEGVSEEEAYDNMENAIARGIQVFPLSLIRLEIERCRLGRQASLALGKLPHLQLLRLWSVDMEGNKLDFCAGSFPQLTYLHLTCLKELEEWEVRDGALPNLQHLYIYLCTKLKKLPEGLPDSVQVTCYSPCIEGIEKYNTCPAFKRQADEANAATEINT